VTRRLAMMLATVYFQAQAATESGIELYGAVDQAVQYSNRALEQDRWRVAHQWGASRLGVRTAEPLKDGWRIRAVLEHRFNANTGQGLDPKRFWNAQSWVALEGPIGVLRLGRDYTPLDQALGWTDCADQGFYFDNAPSEMTSRFDNMVQFRSPTSAPITASLALAPGEQTGQRLMGGALVLGGETQVLQIAQQVLHKPQGRQVESGAGAAFRGERWGGCITRGWVRRDGGSRTSMWHLSGRYQRARGTAYWALKHEVHHGSTSTGVGLSYLYSLSPRTFIYGALGVQPSPRPSGTRLALGLRKYF
jgi:predicted porin